MPSVNDAGGARRWALVTGATGTIGGECARRLAGAGLGVVVHGRRPDAAAEIAAQIAATGGTAVPVAFDISSPADIARAVADLGSREIVPTVLVNAAAEFGPLLPADEIDPADWARIFAINLHGLQALVHGLVPRMRAAGWGRVIQVSSAAALAEPGPGNSAYSASKAAGDRMLGHLSVELAGTGVTVHSMHPGEIASKMWLHIRGESARRDDMADYQQWAASTGEHPEDPARAGELVVSLLDDAAAAAAHGFFLWAQDSDRSPVRLG